MNTHERLKLLNLSVVKDFFVDRGAKDECPSCGTSSWIYTGPSKAAGEYFLGVPFGYLQPNDADSTLIRGLDLMRPSILMTCDNCGFHRIHDALKIAQWAEKRHQELGVEE